MASALSEIYAPIRDELAATEELLDRELRACDPALGDLVSHAARYGGKRLRPALVLLCGRACGGTSDRHVQAAATVELIHTATLIHDDVVDAAELRRQGVTINAAWGDDVSILLGDLLFARAIELFAAFAGPLENRLLARAVREVCEGELLQLMARERPALGEERYVEIIGKKTGALCGVACSLGAAFAGERDGRLDRFAAFGRNLGIAFQIADDCLDIRGNESTVGKTLGLDLRGGKLTLPLIRLRHAGPESARRRLDELLAAPDAEGFRPQLAELLTRSGAFAYCDDAARRFVRRGIERLGFLDERPERGALLALADFVVTRDR